MKKTNLLLLLLITSLLFNCQTDDAVSETPNSSPGNFEITVSSIQSSKAILSWSKSIDPDGDAVSYSIELNNKNIAQNLSNLNYDMDGLSNETLYEVKIIAKDPKGATNVKSKTFSTTSAPLPSDFNVSIDDIDYTEATVTWTESTTSENNDISYSLKLNGETIVENTDNFSHQLTSLSHNTEYTGQIVARADNGQTFTKAFQFTTLKNEAPEAFELVYVAPSFSYIDFKFNAAMDPEGDMLEYRVFLNDEDVTETLYDDSEHSPTPAYNSRIGGLLGNTGYELKIKAIDPYGNESYSNPINFNTQTSPPEHFEIMVSYVDGEIVLIWDKLTEANFELGTANNFLDKSIYILDGVEYNLGDAITSTGIDETIAIFGTNLISPNEQHTLQLVLDWGYNDRKSYSNEVIVNNLIYTPTMAEVNAAKLYNSTAQFFPLQFTITFINGYISEFEDFEVMEIKFHDTVFEDFVFISQGEWNKGYLTGNITQEQFDHLKDFNEGYIITNDETGYHKLEFLYTIEN